MCSPLWGWVLFRESRIGRFFGVREGEEGMGMVIMMSRVRGLWVAFVMVIGYR